MIGYFNKKKEPIIRNVIKLRLKSRITLKVERPWGLFFSTLIYDLSYPLQVQPRQDI